MIDRFHRLIACFALLVAALLPQAVAAATPSWNRNVVATAEGGWLIGNPNAPVKLIEYASYTCPHCAHFATEGLPVLRRDYIAKGKVNLEFRQFALNPVDLTEGMLVRCAATPAAAVAMGEKMLVQQKTILATPPTREQAEQLNATPAARIHAELARIMKLDQWAAANGLSAKRVDACLADLTLRDRIVAIRSAATDDFGVRSTPSFILNGKLLDKTYDWATLEPQLKAALAGK